MAWNDILLSYYPAPVTVAGLSAVHELHLAQAERTPKGTATLGIIGSGIPIPGRDVRAYAARIGRLSSGRLRGECVVIDGHPIWVGMGRSAFRAIQLLSQAWHPREVFGALEPAARWSLTRVARDPSEAPELLAAATGLMARWAEQHAAPNR